MRGCSNAIILTLTGKSNKLQVFQCDLLSDSSELGADRFVSAMRLFCLERTLANDLLGCILEPVIMFNGNRLKKSVTGIMPSKDDSPTVLYHFLHLSFTYEGSVIHYFDSPGSDFTR